MEDIIEEKVLDLFLNQNKSLYYIQKECKLDYHKVRRILSKNNIEFQTRDIKEVDEEKVKLLYQVEKYTLRRIAKELNIDHHRVARILEKHGIEITQEGRNRAPFSEEHRKKISESTKGRQGVWKGKKMPKKTLYKNMLAHIQWEVDLDFLMQFDDIEKLKILNKMLTRDRVSSHFTTEKYKEFILKFYYDKQFCLVYEDYLKENKNKYAMPSLDHIIPLSKGGTWELDNLQILSWVVNRAKFDYMPEEWEYIQKKYFSAAEVSNI